MQDDLNWAEVAEVNAEARSATRRIVNFAASIREMGTTAVRARIANLSETGCNIDGKSYKAGSEIWLKITGLNVIRARSVWTDGAQTGCEFYSPISLPLIEELASEPQKPQRRILFGPGALSKFPSRTA